VEWPSRDVEGLAQILRSLEGDGVKVYMISNRGVKVWPEGMPETSCSESFQCRFLRDDGSAVSQAQVIALLGRASAAGLEFEMLQSLRRSDGLPGYSPAQGE
jgi:isocitrate dehydrogenase